jgi:hypothetical protein
VRDQDAVLLFTTTTPAEMVATILKSNIGQIASERLDSPRWVLCGTNRIRLASFLPLDEPADIRQRAKHIAVLLDGRIAWLSDRVAGQAIVRIGRPTGLHRHTSPKCPGQGSLQRHQSRQVCRDD